jgi:hypothetical protein
MRTALVLAAATMAAFAAGCGGGGDGRNDVSPTAYTESAESICTDLERQGSALTPPSTVAGLVPFARKSAALIGEAVAKLRALEVPSDLEETHARWVDALDEVRAKLEDLARAAQARNQARVNRLARELDQTQGRVDAAVRDLDLDACRDMEGDAGDPARVAAVMEAAGCKVTTVTAGAQALHIRGPNEVVRYDTYPPTSGRHHPSPAIWGKYSVPVDPRQAVHNLEHGGIVVWFGPQISTADRNRLSDFYDESPNAMLLTPIDEQTRFVRYPAHEPLTTELALTAWTTPVDPNEGTPAGRGQGVLARCPHFDRAAFVAFRNEFRGKGPERFAVERLTPGS